MLTPSDGYVIAPARHALCETCERADACPWRARGSLLHVVACGRYTPRPHAQERPLFRGGQGRSRQEIETEGRIALGLILAVILTVLAAALGWFR